MRSSASTTEVANGLLLAELRCVLDGDRLRPRRIRFAPNMVSRKGFRLRPGFHAHDSWELFLPCHAPLRFEVAGCDAMTVPPGAALLVKEGCVHMGVDLLPQSRRLTAVVVALPGDQAKCGLACAQKFPRGGDARVLSRAEHQLWTHLLADSPANVMDRAAEGLAAGGWAAERGAALVGLLIGALGETIAGAKPLACLGSERRIRRVQERLQQSYFDPALSLRRLADEAGLTPTHLCTSFRHATGRTVRQTLIDIRLRRARALLGKGLYTVKEVAAFTGWKNQLYFSAAFRRRYGAPPSALRAVPA